MEFTARKVLLGLHKCLTVYLRGFAFFHKQHPYRNTIWIAKDSDISEVAGRGLNLRGKMEQMENVKQSLAHPMILIQTQLLCASKSKLQITWQDILHHMWFDPGS